MACGGPSSLTRDWTHVSCIGITESCQASVCSSVLSGHNKDLEWWTFKPLVCLRSWTDHVIALRQISVTYSSMLQPATALFYLEDSKRIHPQVQGHGDPKTWREESGGVQQRVGRGVGERAGFGSSFMFLPPPGPALRKLGQPGALFVLPEVLTQVLGPSFVLFLRAFPFLVFKPPPFRTPFSYSNYLT